ncbi:MAG TPA: DedA family protein [Vicinamibacterales bacterium]|nr:DedA family protein [Vicinamibacterales bacterium]
MEYVVDLFLHLDVHLAEFVAQYGVWVYAMLFAIIFIETGLVIWPFLPGDSLLFAAGALAATGVLDIYIVSILLIAAAIAGDAVNYSIGRYVGPKVFSAHDYQGFFHKLLNRDHLDKAHAFFEKHGGLAVVSGRFVPIVRTFVPFVAGAASMTASTFVTYNVVGAIIWVVVCAGAGYAFGNVPIIKENFSLVAIGIVFVSVLPIVIEFIKHRSAASKR